MLLNLRIPDDVTCDDLQGAAGWAMRTSASLQLQKRSFGGSDCAFVVAFAFALWCLLAGPPLLGAVLMTGAFSGLLWTVEATLDSRFVRWLRVGRSN